MEQDRLTKFWLLQEKTASHDMQICVLSKQFLSADWFFTVYFAVDFQTKAKKPLCFLITFLSPSCLVCYFRIPSLTLSESFFGETIISKMTENPTAKYIKFWFCATLLINLGCASVIILVAPNLAVANCASYLKRICLQKVTKS